MSIRELNYSVGINSIEPSYELDAGTQRDIEATNICFSLSEELWQKLGDYSALRFRFDFYDATGKLLRGDSFKIGGKQTLSTKLPFEVTRHGGRILIYLIITKIIDGKTDFEVYSCSARLRIKRLPCGNGCSDGESFTTLAESTKAAAESAEGSSIASKSCSEEAAKSAVAASSAADRAEKASELFDGSNIFIFDGGEASPKADVEIEIDEEAVTDEAWDPDSDNEEERAKASLPITSGGVYKIQEELKQAANDYYDPDSDSEEIKNKSALPITGAGIKALLNLIYPVGSVLTFHDNKNHSSHLGFYWERFAVGKTLIGYDENDGDFNVTGKSGGEKNHKLTVDEMPSHSHSVEVKYKLDTVTNASGVRHTGSGSLTATNEGIKIADAGGDEPHNNLPPYIVTAFWIRSK